MASEINQPAKNAYKENFGIKPLGDISKINVSNTSDHDMLCAGFPCQPFSIIGNNLEFTLFEAETHKFIAADYKWSENQRKNLEGHDISSGQHSFTWQPHGAQFTIKYPVPASAVRFQLKRPPVLAFEQTIKQIGFTEAWVKIK